MIHGEKRISKLRFTIMIHLLLAFQLQRTVAVTIDDLPIISEVRTAANDEYITRELLKTLRAEKIPAIGFVNEGKMFGHPGRTEILKRWLDAGMDLGNHSYSHHDLNTTPLEEFERDVINGERITSRLLKGRGKKIRYFRHPFLHNGGDLKKKRAFESWLKTKGYEVAPVTIDNLDFIYARAYERAKLSGKLERASEIGRQYVAYMEMIFAFYEDQSRKILKREPAQTLLLHASLLNADYMDELATMMKKRGYRFVSITEALKDPAYAMPDNVAGKMGITWLHRWAITAGMDRRIFAGEPEVSADIMKEYR